MVELILRRANTEDSQRLAELITQLGYPASTEEVRSRFELIDHDEEHALFVAVLDERVAGWVHVYIYKLLEAERPAGIGGLVVDEAHRGRGVGRKLMEEAENWAREQGCAEVDLRSNVIRKEAHGFYGAIGYELFKTQHAFRKKLK